MAVFGKVSGYLAHRDAIGNECFRWMTKPIGTQSDAGIAAGGLACVEAQWRIYWRLGPGNLASLRFVLSFEMAAATDMTIVCQAFARQFPCRLHIQYTSFCGFRECTYTPMRPKPDRVCKCRKNLKTFPKI